METESVEVAVVCLSPFMSGVFEANRKGSKLQLSQGYCARRRVCVCPVICVYVYSVRMVCETQRCTVILLFTVSIRFNFLFPLPLLADAALTFTQCHHTILCIQHHKSWP